MYIVELEQGVYLANWKGDPGRTHSINNARKYQYLKQAVSALKRARKYRPFVNAKIYDPFINIPAEAREIERKVKK